jgi:hypothetical protein
MSLLLKALKQAETSAAGKPAAATGAGNFVSDDLELEPVAPASNDAMRDWVEPPSLLFGSSGLSTAQQPSRSLHLPRLTLVPAAALMAVVVALGYGIYLYFALQPTILPPPPDAVAPARPSSALVAAPVPRGPAAKPAAPAVRPQARALPTSAAAETGERNATRPASPPSLPAAPVARPAAPAASPIPVFRPDAHAALLGNAHAAYQAGQLDEALRLYTQAAAVTRSTDALFGLAAIATAQNREQDATQYYREILEREPRNATAQGALLDLTSGPDSLADESRLKTLIDREPNPHLYQTLANLYAEQQRWPEAQNAYFEAFRGAPGNADYAFNLAVSLDMLGQRAAALSYYEKAIALGGIHRFDRAQAEARIRQLKQAQ